MAKKKNEVVKFNVKLAFSVLEQDSKFIPKAIAKVTDSIYYHVEVIIDDLWISSIDTEGVHIKPLKPLNEEWMYHDLGEVTMLKENFDVVMEWVNKQDGKDYDFKGIFLSQLVPLRFHSENKWFCSEISTKTLQLIGIKEVIDLTPNCVSPGDLARVFGINVTLKEWKKSLRVAVA